MNDKYLLHQKFLNESHLAWAVRLSDRILSCNIIGQSPQQINIWFSKGNTVLQLLDYDYLLERILSGNIFILSLFPYCAVLSCFSRVWLFATPWTVACQAPLSMGFSRQEYWSGVPCPSPGDLPNPRTESMFPVVSALQVGSLPLSPPGCQYKLGSS